MCTIFIFLGAVGGVVWGGVLIVDKYIKCTVLIIICLDGIQDRAIGYILSYHLIDPEGDFLGHD